MDGIRFRFETGHRIALRVVFAIHLEGICLGLVGKLGDIGIGWPLGLAV